MNIFYLSGDQRVRRPGSSGPATHVRKTIDGLEREGHSVRSFIAGEQRGASRAKRAARWLRAVLPAAVTLPLRDLHALAHDRTLWRSCRSVCRRGRFDLIYERAVPYYRAGHRLSKEFGLPHVLELNAPIEELIDLHGCSPWLAPVAKRRERRTARQADAVIVGSSAMGDYLVGLGVHQQDILVIYPTAGDEFFEAAGRGAEVRQRWNLDGKTVVGFVGSMAPYHRVDLLVQVWREIARVRDDVHLLVVGDGKELACLTHAVQRDGLQSTVTLTGRVPHDEVPGYCDAMDVCVIPGATWYGSPSKLFEYAACGKPVLGPRVAAVEELIRHGDNGLLSDRDNATELIGNLLSLIDNPGLRRRLGGALREEMLAEHTWSKNTDRLIKIAEARRLAKSRRNATGAANPDTGP